MDRKAGGELGEFLVYGFWFLVVLIQSFLIDYNA
jgi:hypothetical protein